MNSPDLKNRKRFFLFDFLHLPLSLLQKPAIFSYRRDLDPMVRREEKLRDFRRREIAFFKEDHGSPLRSLIETGLRGFLLSIDLKYAMVGAIRTISPLNPNPFMSTFPQPTKGNRKSM